MAVDYAKLQLEDLAGGLADTGNPSVIAPNESPCLYNVDFSRYGSVSVRADGDRLVGEFTDDGREVLGLTTFCICDSCTFFPDPIPPGFESPKPDGQTIMIRSIANKVDTNTTLQYNTFNGDGWINFDTMQGQHPHDFAVFNCRVYYSNGIEPLKFACFRPDPVGSCKVIASVDQPSCFTEYGTTTQPTVIVDINDGYIVFGNGKGSINLPGTPLGTFFNANPGATISLTVPNPSSPNNDVITFTIQVPNPTANQLQNNILYFTNPSANAVGGTFYEKVVFSWSGGAGTWRPSYCQSDTPLADGVKGYILKIHENRLFIAGDLENPDRLAYSRKAQQFSTETDVAIHVGDFDVVGFDRTISDSDRILFTNDCAKITAMVRQDRDLYLHRDTISGPEIYQLLLTEIGEFDGYYRPVVVNSSNAASWFRNITVQNSLQYYITTAFGNPESKAFGLFANFISPKAEDRSQKIRRTMEKIDFTRGAVVYFNRKIYYSGAFREDCDNSREASNFCEGAADQLRKNDIVLVYDIDTGAYTIYRGWNVAVWHPTDNRLYYGSSIDENVYEVAINALQDKVGIPGLNSLEIPALFRLKRFNFNSGGTLKAMKRVYIEGYISPGTTLELGLVFDCNVKYKNVISYKDVQKTEECPDCDDLDCEGCKGRYNSLYFKKHIEFSEEQKFTTVQPYIRSSQGWWQIDTINIFARQLQDDEIEEMVSCGIVNVTNNLCFE